MLLVIPEARRLTSAEEDHSQEQQNGGWQQGLHVAHETFLGAIYLILCLSLHLYSSVCQPNLIFTVWLDGLARYTHMSRGCAMQCNARISSWP